MSGQPSDLLEMTAIPDLLRRGVGAGVFPGAVAAWGRLDEAPRLAWVGRQGESRQTQPVTPETIYDLASLTKVLATTLLLMPLVENGRLDPEAPLKPEYFPLYRGSWPHTWARLTPGHLLSHQSSLAPWRPYYQELAQVSPGDRPARLLTAIVDREEVRPGHTTIYSDLNFLLLGFLAETLWGHSLDQVLAQHFLIPLGLRNNMGFRPLAWARPERLAATEDGPRIGGPLGYPGLPELPAVPPGRVHDDNAAWLDGLAGHAGLFGQAEAVWELVKILIHGRPGLISPATAARFREPRPPAAGGPTRAWGFDLPSPGGALAGANWSPRSVGHLGYTGTSLWYDPERDFTAVLLTNRVHPTARNTRISQFRPRFHQQLGAV